MNKSGLNPCGDRVVVLPDTLEETTAGGIIIPPSEQEKYQLAQVSGVLVAIGPDAWRHTTTITKRLIDGQLKVVEEKTTGYSKPFAEVGDRVSFAKYVGLQFDGDDGNKYRLLNDEDITGTLSESADFTEFRKREPLSKETGNV